MPDIRGWLMVGLFALTTFIFTILAFNLNQSDLRQLFVVLATAVVSGAFCGSLGFFFGSSKSASEKDATIADLSKGTGS